MLFALGMILAFVGLVIVLSTKRERHGSSILRLFVRTRYGDDIWWLQKWVWGLLFVLVGLGMARLGIPVP